MNQNPDRAPDVKSLGDLSWLGVDTREPRDVADGVLNDAGNLRYDGLEVGTRRGVDKPPWANTIEANTGWTVRPWPVATGYGVYREPSGVDWQLVASDGRAYRCTPFNQGVRILLPAGVKLLSRVAFVQAFNNVYAFRGRELAPLVMRSFDDGFEDIVPHYDSTADYGAANPATGDLADEIAYGPYIAVTSITRVSNTATVTTAVVHGYVTGADITIQGANETEYNGRVNITVVDDVTFTYPVYGSPATPATGTITCSNNIYYWKATGSTVTLTSLTSAATTATATKVNHGFTSGQYVTIAGADQTEYNGSYVITVTTADTFTYVFAGSATTPATGTITATTSETLAGQSPDTNPEAWTRVYNILPNANNAIYINNRLLVPTAYQPSSVDGYATFNGGAYYKTDYLVATDYLDDVHFDFANEFRINQGSADEIVDLAKFNDNTVIIWKDKSWAVLYNVAFDLTNLTLDVRSTAYGLASIGAWTLCGSNMYFLASKRGIVSLFMSEQGRTMSVDEPFSAPMEKYINRIQWDVAATSARLESWDSKLYCAVPLDGEATGNDSMLVFDFVALAKAGGQGVIAKGFGWCGLDTGEAICPQEFIKLHVNGKEWLFFLGTDGYVNQVESIEDGDQIANVDDVRGIAVTPIEFYALSRAYHNSLPGLLRPMAGTLVLQTLNPSYSVLLKYNGVAKTTTLDTAVTRSPVVYDRPFDKADWDDTNINDDFHTPNRQDYSLFIPDAGLGLYTDRVTCGLMQEATAGFRIPGGQGRSFQLEVSNTQGRVKLQGMRLGVVPGPAHKGQLQ